MTEVTGRDLVGAIRQVLAASPKPLSLSGIRRALAMPLRTVNLETLHEVLRRQVAAQVVVLYPKHRSNQDRYWNRPIRVHLEQLLRQTLGDGPLPWSEVRRRLPDYAKLRAERLLEEQVARGRIFRHPAAGRLGPRYSLSPPEPHPYLRPELDAILRRLQCLGFSRKQLRASALDYLLEEEWADSPPARLPAQSRHFHGDDDGFEESVEACLVPIGG